MFPGFMRILILFRQISKIHKCRPKSLDEEGLCCLNNQHPVTASRHRLCSLLSWQGLAALIAQDAGKQPEARCVPGEPLLSNELSL